MSRRYLIDDCGLRNKPSDHVTSLEAKLAEKEVENMPLFYELYQLKKLAAIVWKINKKAIEEGESPPIELPEELQNIITVMFNKPDPGNVKINYPRPTFTIEVDGQMLNVNPVPLPMGTGSLCPEDFQVPDAFTFEEAYSRMQGKGKLKWIDTPARKKKTEEFYEEHPEFAPQPPPPKNNKNAYEIRLEILLKATDMANGDPDKAMEIAEKLYKFVDGKRR